MHNSRLVCALVEAELIRSSGEWVIDDVWCIDPLVRWLDPVDCRYMYVVPVRVEQLKYWFRVLFMILFYFEKIEFDNTNYGLWRILYIYYVYIMIESLKRSYGIA